MRTAILLIMLALAPLALSAQAQERIRFQGRLTTPAGAAITTATDVVFRMYAAPTGGTALWTENHSGGSAITPSAAGVFTVELGVITAISGVDFSQPVYVGITVGTDAEMTPRYLLTSAAHAHHAKNAATLGGLARAGFAELTGATFTGQVSATQFNGSGAGLTSIPAGQLTGALPALNGAALTNVNAATLGGLARAGFAELTGATFTGGVTATQFNGSGAGLTSIPAGQLSGALPALDSSALISLNASNLGSGTVPSARLSGTYSGALAFSNVTSATIGTLDVSGTTNLTHAIVSGELKLGWSTSAASASNQGTLRWNSTLKAIEVSDGTDWVEVGKNLGSMQFSSGWSSMPVGSTIQAATGLTVHYVTATGQAGVTTYLDFATTGTQGQFFIAVNRGTNSLTCTGQFAGQALIFGGTAAVFLGSPGEPWRRVDSPSAFPGTVVYSEVSNNAALLAAGFVRSPELDTKTTHVSVDGSGLAGRWDHSAIWTGTNMIVWGGTSGAAPHGDGASFDPQLGNWVKLAATGAPSGRRGHTAVWSGGQMLIWGGQYGASPLGDGARYAPGSDLWTAITASGAPSARYGHTAVWTGTRMLVWGGFNGGATYLNDGASYDPGSDTWTSISTTGAPSARAFHTAVWTGSEMLIWGGRDASVTLGTGARYNPTTNTWAAINMTGAPSARRDHTAVWASSNTAMLVWGGAIAGSALGDGAYYFPSTDSWVAMSGTGAPSARFNHTAVVVSSGSVLYWGGEANGSTVNTGGSFSALSNSWTPLNLYVSTPTARAGPTGIWTGTKMIVWGGSSLPLASAGNGLNTGGTCIEDPNTTNTYRWAGSVSYAYRAP